MKSSYYQTAAWILVGMMFLIALIARPYLPPLMATHWGAQGEVNGYQETNTGLFTLPLITAILGLFLMLVPRIDPLKHNFPKFRQTYDTLIVVITGFMAYLYGLIIAFNLGIKFNFISALVPSMSILFYMIGNLLNQVQPNWFVGLRTPWTLSDPRVWQTTHYWGAKVFKTVAIITLLGIFWPNDYIFLLMGTILPASLGLVAYSYFSFNRLNKPV